MKQSETISKISAAVVGFQSEVGKISKDGKNPHFKSNYATLDNLIDETRPVLAEHGLAVMQSASGDGEGNVIVTTMLIHESGEWLESDPLVLKPVKADPQGMGSAITYAKRYQYGAFLSLSTGEDDDGNAASGLTNRQPASRFGGNSEVDENEKEARRQEAIRKAQEARSGNNNATPAVTPDNGSGDFKPITDGQKKAIENTSKLIANKRKLGEGAHIPFMNDFLSNNFDGLTLDQLSEEQARDAVRLLNAERNK